MCVRRGDSVTRCDAVFWMGGSTMVSRGIEPGGQLASRKASALLEIGSNSIVSWLSIYDDHMFNKEASVERRIGVRVQLALATGEPGFQLNQSRSKMLTYEKILILKKSRKL